MTHITAGPVVIVSNERFKQVPLVNQEVSSDKPATETPGWSGSRVVPGNQATYLFFPNLASMVLIIISSVSTPIIKGLSLADIHMKSAAGASEAGTVKLGAWGWCLSGVIGMGYVRSLLIAEQGEHSHEFQGPMLRSASGRRIIRLPVRVPP